MIAMLLVLAAAQPLRSPAPGGEGGQSEPTAAEVLKRWKHPWSEWGTGATATVKQTSKRPDIDAKGELVFRDEVDTVRYTVIRVDGDKPLIRIESSFNSSEIPFFTAPPTWFRGKAARAGKETLKAGDRSFECDVTTFTLDEGKDLSQKTTVWQSAEAPVWAVKVRVETLLNGKMTTAEEEQLVGPHTTLKIGSKELICQVVEARTEVAGGSTTVRREWRTDEVPGRVARRETKAYQDGKEVPRAAALMEVTAFEAR
jgi:hypothetical protein